MDSLGYARAVILGLLQGVTEFLPISSDGHLVVAERLLGMSGPTLLLNVVLHGGTLLAVVVFYRKDLRALTAGVLRAPRTGLQTNADARLAFMVVAGCVPTGIIGVLLKDPVEHRLSTVYWAGAGFLVTAAALMGAVAFARRGDAVGAPSAITHRRAAADIRLGEALLIGAAQGVAVLPGVSRSALTISAAIWLGIAPIEGARFSFLLAIPAVAGALVLELRHGLGDATAPGPILLGALVAFGAGLLALRVLIGMLGRGRIAEFSYYLVPLGLACLVYGWWRP